MEKLIKAMRLQSVFENTMADMGHTTHTTFFMDFSIADDFGVDAVKDTYKRAMNDWKNDYIFITELYIVLNHKIWQWYEKDNDLAKLYDELWRDCGSYVDDNFTKKQLEYFYKITD